jgi:hypothetical protein
MTSRVHSDSLAREMMPADTMRTSSRRSRTAVKDASLRAGWKRQEKAP